MRNETVVDYQQRGNGLKVQSWRLGVQGLLRKTLSIRQEVCEKSETN